MTSKDRVLAREMERAMAEGLAAAAAVQEKSAEMTGTELNGAKGDIPRFAEAVKKKNMLERKIGFICISSAGRVVKLLQPYDSTIFTDEPEELPAQWGFIWSNDPAHAKPFIALSTSTYMKGNCCSENDEVFRSLIDNNVHAPSAYPDGWEKVEE